MVQLVCFLFKRTTAYEMRIRDWSSDVCSSDLPRPAPDHVAVDRRRVQKVAAAEQRAGVLQRVECRSEVGCCGRCGGPLHPGHLARVQVEGDADSLAAAGERHRAMPDVGRETRSEEHRVGKECVNTCRYQC